MKKSIKYAGIAAATLLAVAPVAAPVVSNTTTVKADASSATQDYKDIENAADAFKTAATSSNTLASTLNGQLKDLTLNNPVSYADFMGTTAATKLLSGYKASDLLKNTDRNATVTVTAKYGKESINNLTDLDKILGDDNLDAVVFTITLNYNDVNGKASDRVATFTTSRPSTPSTADLVTTAKTTFNTPVNVALNSSTTSTQLSSSSNVKIVDQNGNNLLFSNFQAGSFFNSYTDALNDDNAITDTSVIKNNKFVKAGTYYQAISVTPGTQLAKFVQSYLSDPVNNKVYVNGNLASKGSDFAVVKDNANLVKSGDLLFVREINVSSSSDQWTTEDVKGVVTTKSDSSFYTLKNGENQTISNRALAKNTAWQTNAVRTDQNGNKQYRVGADEWIDASYVTFSDGNYGNGSTTGAYTDVKALNGKVTTAGPAGYYYPLYNDNGELISSRGVAGLSSWYTDKSAKNADGVTVYHVATGEWLQGTNVTYTAY